MGAVAAIIAKDLRLRLRDWSLVIYGFVAPFVLAAVLGLVFGDVDQPVELDVAVAGALDQPLGTALVDEALPPLREDGLVTDVTTYDDGQGATDGLRDGVHDVGFVVLPGQAGGIEVLADADQPIARAVAEGIAGQLVAEARAAATVATTAAAAGRDPVAGVEAVLAAPRAVEVRESTVGTPPLDATTGVAAGISVFFLLFAVGLAATGLLEEQRDRTLARLRVAPIPSWAPVVAKALLGLIVGVASMTALVVATSVTPGADWGAPVPVAIVVLAGVVAAVGVVAASTTGASTPEGAINTLGVVGTIMGAVGGSFFPITGGGGLLTALASLTPHRWFLVGIREAAAGSGVTGVLPAAGVLLVIGAVGAVVGVVRFRRTLVT